MAITNTDVDYYDGSDRLSGVLVRNSGIADKRPGILIFHEAWGLNDYILSRARMIAELGYIAFAADIFGGRRIISKPAEAMPITKSYRENPAKLRARATAAFDTLLEQSNVDAQRTAAMGYCFGGTTALELARTGANLAAVVSIHGTLASAALVNHPGIIKASVLACVGSDDPIIPPTQVAAFQEEMTKAKADFQILVLGGAMHGFSNPDADNIPLDSVAYNAEADQRSWAAMKNLFSTAFA